MTFLLIIFKKWSSDILSRTFWGKLSQVLPEYSKPWGDPRVCGPRRWCLDRWYRLPFVVVVVVVKVWQPRKLSFCFVILIENVNQYNFECSWSTKTCFIGCKRLEGGRRAVMSNFMFTSNNAAKTLSRYPLVMLFCVEKKIKIICYVNMIFCLKVREKS